MGGGGGRGGSLKDKYNLVSRALVTLVPAPLDKGNEGTGNEIGINNQAF